MNTKNNQRAQLTRCKIKEVFIELLGTKAINQITVQELCKKTGINRTTFYAHYDDVYDLMRKIELEKCEELKILLEIPEDKDPASFCDITELEISKQEINEVLSVHNLEKLCSFIAKNSSFYRIYFNDFNIKYINQYFPSLHRPDMFSHTRTRYQLEFLQNGISGVIRTWLNAELKESPEEMARILKDCIVN